MTQPSAAIYSHCQFSSTDGSTSFACLGSLFRRTLRLSGTALQLGRCIKHTHILSIGICISYIRTGRVHTTLSRQGMRTSPRFAVSGWSKLTSLLYCVVCMYVLTYISSIDCVQFNALLNIRPKHELFHICA